MGAYVVRRLVLAVIIILLVTLLVFFAMRLLPGDPILMLVTSSQQAEYNQEQIDLLRHEFGLDKPLMVQYFDWMGGMFRGDLGTSILNRTPVMDEIVRRLPITINIGVISFVLGAVIGIGAGILSAVRRGSGMDTFVTTLANLGVCIPTFWIAIMMMYLFGLYLGWLPIMGYTSPFEDLTMNVRQLIMPVFCEAIGPIAMLTRQSRSSMLEVMQADYVRTAWSKGLTERLVIVRHVMRNGMIPVITLLGMGVPMILGGSVFIESVFNIPGIGRLAVSAITNQDYPYVQAVVLISALAVVLSNLAVDLLYGWIDPRIRIT